METKNWGFGYINFQAISYSVSYNAKFKYLVHIFRVSFVISFNLSPNSNPYSLDLGKNGKIVHKKVGSVKQIVRRSSSLQLVYTSD